VANGLGNVIKGGAIQIGVKSADHIAFNYLVKSGTYTDKQLRSNIWFTEINPAIPPVDNIILNLGLPAALLVIGKATKNKGTVAMGTGAALTGVAAFLSDLLGRSQARPGVPFGAPTLSSPQSMPRNGQPIQNPTIARAANEPPDTILWC